MRDNLNRIQQKDPQSVCHKVKDLISREKLGECEQVIKDAMREYPHAPEPHNLFGILLETKGEHAAAMKHFRAAWALDPTYLPVRYNLEQFGSMARSSKCAYNESDCKMDCETDCQEDWS